MALDRTDVFAFAPYNGGQGIRVSLTTSPSAPVPIPGVGTASTVRIMLTNGGSVSAFVQLGPGTVANLNSMEVLPGTQIVVSIPAALSATGLTISGITASGATTISAVSGDGT